MKTRAKTPKGILRAAARYIEEHGWYQGASVDPISGAVCAFGAISAVVTGRPTGRLVPDEARLVDLATDEADDRVERLQGGHGGIIGFNDDTETTKEMVLAVLRG